MNLTTRKDLDRRRDSEPGYRYFLFISILQFFRSFSTISPGVVILPLVIILALTAIKDGYEDIKRHQTEITALSASYQGLRKIRTKRLKNTPVSCDICCHINMTLAYF